ncbi:MAG: hypothetical protein K0Q59_3385 [Paenibacillus sp.]|jgi:hypothetical protein|nr:hypothetical protein [Paenibacillus sp.]
MEEITKPKKTGKLGVYAGFVFTLLCVLAIAASTITDFAINASFTWSTYVLLSVPFGWIVLTPMLMLGKFRMLGSIFVITITLLPFLYMMDKIAPVNGWYADFGMTVGIAGIIALWVTYAFVRWVGMNGWFKAAFLIFFYGAILRTAIQYYLRDYIGESMINLDLVISIAGSIVIAVLLLMIGFGRKAVRRAE